MATYSLKQERMEFIITELRAIHPGLPRDVPLQACYTSDLELDSLDLVELAARIEHRFGVNVPDVDLDHFMSVEATAEYLAARLKPK